MVQAGADCAPSGLEVESYYDEWRCHSLRYGAPSGLALGISDIQGMGVVDPPGISESMIKYFRLLRGFGALKGRNILASRNAGCQGWK